MIKIYATIILFFLSLSFGMAQDLELANNYYTQGEYDKANEIYKKLSHNKSMAIQIHDNYLGCLYKIKDYDSAEKFLKTQIKNNENNIEYKAQIAQLFEISGQTAKANAEYQKVINIGAQYENLMFELHNFFYKTDQIDKVIKLIETARISQKSPNKYQSFLARAYLYNGQKDKMMDELLNYGVQEPLNINYVQMNVQDNIKTEEETAMFETKVYDRIQADPNQSFYNELLVWYFTQKSDF